MKLEKFLQDNYNYNPNVKDVLKTYIQSWNSWYEGNVKSFHNYFIYNGQKKVNQKRFSLNMAKEISEEWSDILWSEKCEISFKNEKSRNDFDELIEELDLYSVINQAIEKACALGTEMAVVGVYDIVQNEEGMTLDAWINSKYNTIGVKYDDNGTIVSKNCIRLTSVEIVDPEMIINEYTDIYEFSPQHPYRNGICS